MTFTLKFTDGYLPEQSAAEYVWGIKVSDNAKFMAARPDIFGTDGKADVPYDVVNMGFVIFSPICPHLGCYTVERLAEQVHVPVPRLAIYV